MTHEREILIQEKEGPKSLKASWSKILDKEELSSKNLRAARLGGGQWSKQSGHGSHLLLGPCTASSLHGIQGQK